MKRPKRSTVNRHARTGLALFDLARIAGEMATAAAQTIHDRTQRMARAGLNPSAHDRKEFLLMGQEKLEAAAESSTRMVTEAMAFNQHLARLVLRQIQAQTAAWSGAVLGTPHGWMNGYARLVQGAFANSQAIGAAVGHALIRSAAAGLKPIHGRARANAKRLGRRKRR
jgi:hypothetical protein